LPFALLLELTDLLPRTDINHYVIHNYGKQNYNENSHPDSVGVPQFCILNFDFCILKLTDGQFEFLLLPFPTVPTIISPA